MKTRRKANRKLSKFFDNLEKVEEQTTKALMVPRSFWDNRHN